MTSAHRLGVAPRVTVFPRKGLPVIPPTGLASTQPNLQLPTALFFSLLHVCHRSNIASLVCIVSPTPPRLRRSVLLASSGLIQKPKPGHARPRQSRPGPDQTQEKPSSSISRGSHRVGRENVPLAHRDGGEGGTADGRASHGLRLYRQLTSNM